MKTIGKVSNTNVHYVILRTLGMIARINEAADYLKESFKHNRSYCVHGESAPALMELTIRGEMSNTNVHYVILRTLGKVSNTIVHIVYLENQRPH